MYSYEDRIRAVKLYIKWGKLLISGSDGSTLRPNIWTTQLRCRWWCGAVCSSQMAQSAREINSEEEMLAVSRSLAVFLRIVW